MDRQHIVPRAAAWMHARGWKTKLAKRRGYEQSLFDHSLIELDVLFELLPILGSPRHYDLSDTEQKVLTTAILAHDVGKESDAWQAYIRDPRPDHWVPHVLPELTRAVVPEMCIALEFEDLSEPIQHIMAHCAEFHHARHDFSEQHRRQEWEMGEYEADLATLLKRAVGLAWNEKLGMLTIRGLGKYRRVHASEFFDDDDCSLILETQDFPNFLLYQDGEPTPVSDLMSRENHVFAVVPKADLKAEVDWRLPVFEAGRYVIAFDGAALLLLEIWRESSNSLGVT